MDGAREVLLILELKTSQGDVQESIKASPDSDWPLCFWVGLIRFEADLLRRGQLAGALIEAICGGNVGWQQFVGRQIAGLAATGNTADEIHI